MVLYAPGLPMVSSATPSLETTVIERRKPPAEEVVKTPLSEIANCGRVTRDPTFSAKARGVPESERRSASKGCANRGAAAKKQKPTRRGVKSRVESGEHRRRGLSLRSEFQRTDIDSSALLIRTTGPIKEFLA